MTRFNVFEGSRRVTLLLKLLWAAGAIIVLWIAPTHASLHFATNSPNERFQSVTDDCDWRTDAIESIDRDIGDGKTASVILCFKARRVASGQQIVPFKIESNGYWLGDDESSSDVRVYSQGRANTFTLSQVDQQVARDKWRRQHWKNIAIGFLSAICGWISLSLLQMVIGWIVRGFLGIPWGQDRRPELPATQA